MVAASSVLATGLPQEEQKRTFAESNVPQEEQVDIILRYSLPQSFASRL